MWLKLKIFFGYVILVLLSFFYYLSVPSGTDVETHVA